MIIRRNTGFATAFLTTLFILSSSFLVNTEDTDYPSVAYPPNSWINVPVFDLGFWDSAGVRPILITGTFVCGFHCQNLQGCLFAISIFQSNTSNGTISSLSPKIVWSANRNNPVKYRAALQLSEKGDLMLQDLDGSLVWNTNTMGKFVSGLNLSEEGNLVLYGRNNELVWQSFDHPTYTASADTPSADMPSANTPSIDTPSADTLSADTPRAGHITAILGSTLGVIVFILLVVVGMFSLRRNKNDSKDERRDPQKLRRLRFTRFSYDYLCAMTENFSVKLGEGGFGSVFYGSLPNSTKIAVKRLDGTDHVKKSFLAEVETLGSVHHINLVTLIGFCAEKSHRLLVYEYLQNGSLDRWIFSRNPVCTLSWKLRERIIHDVAKGLAYLHEGCNQKILHLDIKPQNILLDENFNARVADFGLSKLIDRDQKQVLTTMRGTPGYMAPEWSSATITEKVDVYSFGIVVLEILCGRKNVDRNQPEEEMHLLRLFTKKADEGKLLELVDKFSEDMQSNGAEAVKMMRIAAWCLQTDYTRRPSMLAVLKVLDRDLNVEDNLSYDFLNLKAPRAIATPSNRAGTTTLALPSILSGPR